MRTPFVAAAMCLAALALAACKFAKDFLVSFHTLGGLAVAGNATR
jgi:hypothetical protein